MSDSSGSATHQTSFLPAEQKIRLVLEKASEREYDLVVGMSSGGIDSFVAIEAVRRYGPEYGIEIDAIAHLNTGTGIPSTTAAIQDYCAKHDIPYIELLNSTPKETVGVRILNYGFPGRGEGRAFVDRKHATQFALRKERPDREIYKAFSGQILKISGAYADESDLRARKMKQGAVNFGETGDRKPRRTMVSPIFGLTEHQVEQFHEKHDLPKVPAYDLLGTSGDCTGCAYSDVSKFWSLWALAPHLAFSFATLMVWLQMRRARGDVDMPPERVLWGWGTLSDEQIATLRAEDPYWSGEVAGGPDVDTDPDGYNKDIEDYCSSCADQCEPAFPITVGETEGANA